MKEFHPIALTYPSLSKKKFDELREHIRAHGLLHPIVLFEEKVLCGVHRERACRELGIPADYITPEIPDPYAYVDGDNEIRRGELTSSQKAVVAEKQATLRHGGDRKSQIIKSPGEDLIPTRTVIAARLGTSKTQMDKVRIAKKRGGQHFVEAIESGTVSADQAYEISCRPKTKHDEALAAAIAKKASQPTKTPRAPKTPKTPKTPKPKLQWTPEEEAKDKACLERINRPSTFPKDAFISQHSNRDETRLREAIYWVRDNEVNIASFNQKQCDQLLLCTNGIHSYELDFRLDPKLCGTSPRPDGKLDPRFLDWAQDIWVKRERQETRLELRRALRRRREAKPDFKAPSTFEHRFTAFWMTIEDSLETFRRDGYAKFMKAFRDEAKQFFSTSGENRDAADVAAVQKSGDTAEDS